MIVVMCFLPVGGMAQSAEWLEMRQEKLYKDSVKFHEHPLRRYYPHRCQNSKGAYGWVGKNHQVIIPLIYNLFPENLQPRMIVAIKGKHGVIDAAGKIILPLEYKDIYISRDSQLLYTWKAADLQGVRDMNGREILPEKYQGIGEDGDTLLLASVKKKGIEIYTRAGKLVGRSEYEFYWRPCKNRIIVHKEFNRRPSAGLLDEHQNILIPPRYSAVFWATENWAFVSDVDNEMGLIYLPTGALTDCGKLLVEAQDENGNFILNKDLAYYGLWDSLLQEIYPISLRRIQPIKGSPYYILKTRKSQFGIGNSNGTLLVDTIYNHIAQAFIMVESPETKSAESKRMLPFWLYNDNDDVYTANQTGLWHEKKGIVAPAGSFEKTYPFSNTTYFTCADDACLLRSLEGEILSGPYYDMDILRYRYLLAQTVAGGEWSVLDSVGQVINTVPNWPNELEKGFFAVEKKLLYALFDPGLSPLTAYNYESLSPFQSLPEKYWPQAVAMDGTNGFSSWVAWGIDRDSGNTVLLDTNGKPYICQE